MGDGKNDEVCNLLSTSRPQAIPLCHQMAQQCDEQKQTGRKTFEVCNSTRTQCHTSDSYTKCLEASAHLAFELTPSYTGFLPQNGLDAIRRALSPFQVANNSRLVEIKAKELLFKFGFIKREEKISQVLNGRIVDAYQSSGEGSKLIIIFLDEHNNAEVKEQIVEAIKVLKSRGLRFVGLENVPEGHRLIPVAGNPDCKSGEFLMPVIGCELGSEMFVFGTENPDLFEKNKKQLIEVFELLGSSEKTKVCKGMNDIKEALEVAYYRSQLIASHLVAVMTHFQSKTTALTIGSAHLVDLQTEFQQRNISYIAVAVPGFDRSTKNGVGKLKALETFFQENCNH